MLICSIFCQIFWHIKEKTLVVRICVWVCVPKCTLGGQKRVSNALEQWLSILLVSQPPTYDGFSYCSNPIHKIIATSSL